MDDPGPAIDLGPENDRQLARLRRVLTLGSGFQLVVVEISHPVLGAAVLRLLRAWGGVGGVPPLAIVTARPGRDPMAALRGASTGAVLVGIDPTIVVKAIAVPVATSTENATAPSSFRDPVEQMFTTLNWYRDQLPSVVAGPLVLVLTPDGLRKLFVHAPDLLAWRSHTTRIVLPRPLEPEVRPWQSLRAALEEKAWLERMIASDAANLEDHVARAVPGWLARLGDIEARQTGDCWKEPFTRALALAPWRRDIPIWLEETAERRALDDSRYDDAAMHERNATALLSDSFDIDQARGPAYATPEPGGGRGERGRVDAVRAFAALQTVRAERLLCIGEVERATCAADSALRWARTSLNLTLVMEATAAAAAIAMQRGDLLDAIRRFNDMRELSRTLEDRPAELFAILRLAELTADLPDKRQLLLQVLTLARDSDHEARARAAIGLVRHDLLATLIPEQAEQVLRELEPSPELSLKTRIHALVARGAVAAARDNPGAALVAYQRAWEEQQRLAPPLRQHAYVGILLGDAARRTGDVERARWAYQQAGELALVLADRSVSAAARARLARIDRGEPGPAAGDHEARWWTSSEVLAWFSPPYVACSPAATLADRTASDQAVALEAKLLAVEAIRYRDVFGPHPSAA